MRYACWISILTVAPTTVKRPPFARNITRVSPELFGLIDATSKEGLSVPFTCGSNGIATATITTIASSVCRLIVSSISLDRVEPSHLYNTRSALLVDNFFKLGQHSPHV